MVAKHVRLAGCPILLIFNLYNLWTHIECAACLNRLEGVWVCRETVDSDLDLVTRAGPVEIESRTKRRVG